MYSILEHYLSTNHIPMIGMIVTFILTFFFTGASVFLLPSDQGRAFAVNGSPSKGKLGGWFHFCAVLFNQQLCYFFRLTWSM